MKSVSGLNYLLILLVPVRRPANRQKPNELTVLARLVGVVAGLAFLILSATAVLTALWDAFGAH